MAEKIFGLITARGGSKRLPGKHLLKVGGVSLLERSIKSALQAKSLDSVILSTDDPELARLGREWGAKVPFIRPSEFSQDQSKVIDVILHAATEMNRLGDIVCLLQPTSPFRTAKHIDEAANFYLSRPDVLSLMSVQKTAFEKSWLKEIDDKGIMHPVSPFDPLKVYRGDEKELYQLNGALYFMRIKDLSKHQSFHTDKTLSYVMSREDSIDIDDHFDFELAQLISQRRGKDEFRS